MLKKSKFLNNISMLLLVLAPLVAGRHISGWTWHEPELPRKILVMNKG